VSLEFTDARTKGSSCLYREQNSHHRKRIIIYDVTDHKVKYLKDGSWFDLSVDTTGQADLSIQSTKTELANAKTVIGTDGATNSTSGILVLSDTDKAMILPRVASHTLTSSTLHRE
jgi:hypothetical protein